MTTQDVVSDRVIRSRKARKILLIAAAFSVFATASWADAPSPTPPAEWEKFATPKADKIVVFKGLRKLELRRGDEVIRTYHVALGRTPFGKKVEEGDGRTPEGTYIIDRRNMMSDYHLALHISYPSQEDSQQARARGVSPGGAIMIHGEPSYLTPKERLRLKKDWTAGCIALTNAEIAEVWRLVDDGVQVEINP